MKKKTLILIMSLFVFTASVLAQVNESSDPALNKFEGIWKWGNDRDSLTFILQKQMVSCTPYYRMEKIVGWHKYIQNGKVTESSVQYFGSNDRSSSQKNTLIGGMQKSGDLVLNFYDLTLRKDVQIWCRQMPGSRMQLDCRVASKDSTVAATNRFTLPSGFILTKQ
jgi:hypothetical protein